jgi:hypothetical protein
MFPLGYFIFYFIEFFNLRSVNCHAEYKLLGTKLPEIFSSDHSYLFLKTIFTCSLRSLVKIVAETNTRIWDMVPSYHLFVHNNYPKKKETYSRDFFVSANIIQQVVDFWFWNRLYVVKILLHQWCFLNHLLMVKFSQMFIWRCQRAHTWSPASCHHSRCLCGNRYRSLCYKEKGTVYVSCGCIRISHRPFQN